MCSGCDAISRLDVFRHAIADFHDGSCKVAAGDGAGGGDFEAGVFPVLYLKSEVSETADESGISWFESLGGKGGTHCWIQSNRVNFCEDISRSQLRHRYFCNLGSIAIDGDGFHLLRNFGRHFGNIDQFTAVVQ